MSGTLSTSATKSGAGPRFRRDGGLTARKYMVIAGTTRVTASRHISDLLEKGLIVRAPGPSGRSTRYDIALAGWEWRARQDSNL